MLLAMTILVIWSLIGSFLIGLFNWDDGDHDDQIVAALLPCYVFYCFGKFLGELFQ